MEKPVTLPDGFAEAFAEMARKIEGAFDNCDDNPQTMRHAYMRTLYAFTQFCASAGVDVDITDRLSNLCAMLDDLDRGVVHPVLVPTRVGHRKRDSVFLWNARQDVVAGVHCLERSGMALDAAVSVVVKDYPECGRLLRPGANLASSVHRWCERFPDVVVHISIERIANGEPIEQGVSDEYEKYGRQLLAKVCERSADFDPEPEWWRDEFPDEDDET